VSFSTRHQLDAVAVVLIPPRALASPATRAPRRPGSATWRHLIERLIPITVIGAVLLAGSATAASGPDWPRAEARHGVRARAVRDGRHRAQPCERSGAARCGPVDVAVSASAEVVRRRGRRQSRAGSARPRGECRAGSDRRRVREIVKEVGHLLWLHLRRATRLTDLHRVKQLDERIPALARKARGPKVAIWASWPSPRRGKPRRRRRGR
jgi:hypothetical protein